MLQLFDNILSKLANWLLNLGAFVAYPVLICLVLTDISLRTFFNSPLPWGIELSGLILIVCFFAPVCTCEEEKSNIALDFLSCKFSPLGTAILELVSCVSGGLWIGLLCYRNFVEIPDMIEYGETGVEFHYPLWPLRLFLAISLLLLFLRLLLNGIKAAKSITKGGAK